MALSSKLSPDGEQHILNKSVDGYCTETQTIYQFHECFVHGCKECYDGDAINMVVNESFYTLRERTRRTTCLFESQGYTVIEKWECDFIQENKITQTLLKVLRQRDFFINVNLNPRDALFGGKTSPAILFYESVVKKCVMWILLPFTPMFRKKNVYPIKHPDIIRGITNCRDVEIKNVFGIIKCKILPPKQLLFPVLPYRTDKLTFPLCRTCVQELCTLCRHTDEERALY
ncbi:DNA polymerase, partial [Paramuricea clavata]